MKRILAACSIRTGSILLAAAAVLLGAPAAFAAQETINPILDNTIYQDDSTVSCGIGSHLISGRTDNGFPRRALMQFDVAGTVAAGSTITGVTLSITVNRVRDNAARGMSLHRVTQAWGEGGSNCDGNEGKGVPAQTGDATWSHRMWNTDLWTPAAGGTFNATASATASIPDSNGSFSWSGGSLVADVQDMLDNPMPNYGWIVIGEEGIDKTARRFYSTNEGQVARRPALIVDFDPPGGVEACCTVEGFCTLEDPAACAGTTVSGVTTCSPNPCPQPQGACCSVTGTCTEIGQADCIDGGGTFEGEGTVCTPNPCSAVGLEKFVDPLPIPAVATPTSGTVGGTATYDIAVTEFDQQLHRDLPPTRVWGYGGSYPGPTIVASSGEPVTVNWSNDLRDETGTLRTAHYLAVDTCPHGPDAWGDTPRIVTHMHGAHVPARYDGYPEHTWMPGESGTYIYPNNQLPGTLWYHDHALGITRLNVIMGMAGFYLLVDPYEQALNLPGAPYEIGLAIQDRAFNADGTFAYPTVLQQTFYGDTILVNGKVWPYLDVVQGKYRFRMLGGSNSRVYTLSLSTGDPFWVIGTELGLRQSPLSVTELTFAPGERYDVVIDFEPYPIGTEIILTNSAPIKWPNPGNPTEGVLPEIMKFIVVGSGGHTDPLPATLRPYPLIPESESVATRTLTLLKDPTACGGGEWLIDGLHWDDITEIPNLGTTEIWEWVNDSNIMHPMHMHLVAFQILNRFALDGSGLPTGPAIPPEPYEIGWKDTALAHPGTVTRVIARFDDYVGKYAYHCHILEHEDHEMMRQFRTVEGLCNSDGVCDPGEDCIGCLNDCPALPGTACGNGLCEAGNGEDCVNCPADCDGKQNGGVQNQYCCGGGGGTNPVDCSDSRCSTGGFHCRQSTRPDVCCGDFMCEGTEDIGSCSLDCSPDSDGDGFFDWGDCDNADPTATAVPGAVEAVFVQPLGTIDRFLWDSLSFSAGSGTVYDVYTGLISDLQADGGLQSGICESDDRTMTFMDDATADPPLGDARYFMFRGQNSCPGGTGTYGDANRDTTHGASGGSCG